MAITLILVLTPRRLSPQPAPIPGQHEPAHGPAKTNRIATCHSALHVACQPPPHVILRRNSCCKHPTMHTPPTRLAGRSGESKTPTGTVKAQSTEMCHVITRIHAFECGQPQGPRAPCRQLCPALTITSAAYGLAGRLKVKAIQETGANIQWRGVVQAVRDWHHLRSARMNQDSTLWLGRFRTCMARVACCQLEQESDGHVATRDRPDGRWETKPKPCRCMSSETRVETGNGSE